MKRRPAQVHGILCIDKPAGWTSRDVVNKAGGLLGEKRAGHAGTLDPDATGVLLLAFGEATRAVPWLMDASKTYLTRVRFGAATSTDDAAGEIVREAAVPDDLAERLPGLLTPDTFGWIEQVPPAVSALQQDGVRDHERVRRGEVVQRPPRRVWLGQVRLLAVEDQEADLEVTCGAGFYIRSLARDLGERLGSAAHVRTLRRTSAGGFDLSEAVTIEALQAMDRDERRQRLVPVVEALRRVLPCRQVDAQTALHLRQGKKPLSPEGWLLPGAEALLLDPDGEPICVAQVVAEPDQPAVLKVVRGFPTVAADPDRTPLETPDAAGLR